MIDEIASAIRRPSFRAGMTTLIEAFSLNAATLILKERQDQGV
jgi:hypothetical protein